MAEVTKTIQDLDKVSRDDLAPGIPASALPSKEFIEQVERIEAAKKLQQLQPTPPPPQPVASQPPLVKKPITLEYQFSGNCPTCSLANIRTIILKTGRSHIAVAYCEDCKRDIKQIPVKPLIEEKEVQQNGTKLSTSGVSVPKRVRKVPQEDKNTLQSTN